VRDEQVTDKVRFLRRLNLFEGMSEGELEAISRELTMQHCSAGERIGGRHDHVYLIKEGRVRLYTLSRDGHEVTTAVLVPGQLFGLGAFFGGGEEPSFAECVDGCYVCEAGAQDFVGILARHPLLMARVVMVMARQIFRLQQAVESMALEPARARLARHLLELAELGERDAEGRLLPPQTRDDMARVITSTRETVSRTLAMWTRQGVISMRGRRIVLRDPAALRSELLDGA
jgi:CRP/FNR family transcriptional regulator